MKQKTWAALLRGINVGGKNKLPMAKLRSVAEGLGWSGVKTYIASGNMVFSANGKADALAEALKSALKSETGLDLPVLVLPGDAIREALSACPFAPDDPRQVHVCFLMADPSPDQKVLDRYQAASEELTISGRLAWFHTPDGFGRSELANRLETAIGCPLTARNLRTVATLAEMLP